ncbi:MAG: ABC transporter permease, partial [bacterium]|nr:ABC transporter permease [bacterium]
MSDDFEKGTSLWQDAWFRLVRNKAAVVSAVFVIVLILLALLTPWIAPYEFDAINYDNIGTGPSLSHWFGADVLGRDLLSRCLYGLRISLAVGFVATLVSFFIGITYGATAGFFGGKVDTIMMRFVDT